VLSVVWSIIVYCRCVKCNDHRYVNYLRGLLIHIDLLIASTRLALYQINIVLYFYHKDGNIIIRQHMDPPPRRACTEPWRLIQQSAAPSGRARLTGDPRTDPASQCPGHPGVLMDPLCLFQISNLISVTSTWIRNIFKNKINNLYVSLFNKLI